MPTRTYGLGDLGVTDVTTALEQRAGSAQSVGAADQPEAGSETPNQTGSSWAAVNLADTIEGLMAGTITRPAPTIGRRADGGALFYRGKVNGVAGASNAGKSWTGFYTAAQEIMAGNHAVYIDLEDDMAAAVARLLDLGMQPADILERFHYVPPEEAFTHAAAEQLGALLDAVHPTLVVIDSTGESMALDGAKPNDDDDVARWFRQLPTAVARRSGAAVVVLDHVTKADDGGLWPIGSQRKRAAIGGAQYMQVNVRPFDRSTPGYSKLICAKDRHGHYRREQTVALLKVTPGPDGVTLELGTPQETGSSGVGTWRPTGFMERISKTLETAGEPLSGREITKRVPGREERITAALKVLVEEERVQVATGPRNAKLHTVATPYRQTEDPKSDLYAGRHSPTPTTVECPSPLGGGDGDGHSDRLPEADGDGRRQSGTQRRIIAGQPHNVDLTTGVVTDTQEKSA